MPIANSQIGLPDMLDCGALDMIAVSVLCVLGVGVLAVGALSAGGGVVVCCVCAAEGLGKTSRVDSGNSASRHCSALMSYQAICIAGSTNFPACVAITAARSSRVPMFPCDPVLLSKIGFSG